MLQMLTPFSHRQRTSTEYFDEVPHNLIHGINPRSPHLLVPLGRLDVRIGPLIYYGVRFSELRPSVDSQVRRPYPYAPSGPGRPPLRPTAPAPPAPRPESAPQMQASANATPAPAPRPPAQPAPSQPAPPATPAVPPATPAVPPAPPGTPPLHERTPEQHVQYLLYLARTGQVTPEQMPKLNALIAVFARQIPQQRAAVPPGPPSPPVIVVEFPENASVSFLIPTWHCSAERRHAPSPEGRRSLVLSFLGPAIGAKAAGDSGKADAARATNSVLLSDASEAPPPQPADRRKKRDKKAQPPSRAHEIYPITWSISSDIGVDERLWECVGRIPGCITTLPGGRQVWASEQSHNAFLALRDSFARRVRRC